MKTPQRYGGFCRNLARSSPAGFPMKSPIPHLRKSYFTGKPCRLQSHPLLYAKFVFNPFRSFPFVFPDTWLYD